MTGAETSISDLEVVKQYSTVPVLTGRPDNLQSLKKAHGFIIGSYFKKDGHANNAVIPERVEQLMATAYTCRNIRETRTML